MASDKSGLQRLEQFVSKPAAQILGTSARDLANGLKRNQAGRVVFNTAGGPVDVVKALEEALAVVSQLGVGENEELCMVSFRSVAALSVKFAKELSNSELMCQAVRKFVLSRAEWLMSKSSAPFLSGKITKPVVPSDLLAMTFTYAVPSMQNALYYEHHSASSCVRQWTTKLVYQDEFVGVVVPAILLLLGSEPAFEQMQPGRRLDARKRLQRVMLSFLNSVVNRVVLTSEQYVKALSSLVAEPYLRMQLLVLIAQDVTTASADHARAAAMFTRVLWNRAEFRQLLHGRSNEQRRTMMLQRMNETLLTIAHRTDVRTTPFESECLELLADMLGDDHVYRSFWAAHETSICTSIGEISNKHSTFFALGVQPKTERRKLVVTLVRLYVALNRHGQLVSALLHFIRTFQRREVLCRHFKLLWALFSANMPAQRTELGDTLAAAYKKMRLEITAKAVKLKPTGAGVLVDLTPEAEEAAWAKARVAYARAEERAREKQKLHDQREQRRQRKQDRKAVLNSRGSRSQSGVRLAQGSAVSLPPQVGLSRSIRSLTDTFENLEQNRYVGRVRPSQLDIDISVCTCAARRRLVESQAQAQGPVLAPKEHEPVCDVLRCRNARARIECVRGVCMGDCGNQRLQRDQRASTVPAYSKKHKFGLRTNGRLRPGDFVIEYVGEVMSIDSFASDPQRIRAAQLCCRVVLLDGVDVIDASRAGNLARFVNHSCNPNCELQRWSVGAETRLAVVARRSIRAGTEITVDYGRDFVGGVRHACQCNSRLCRRVVEYMLDETVAMHPMLRPPLPNWVSELRPEHSGESPDSSPAKGSLAQVDALLTTISNLSPTPFRRVARARTRKRKQGEPDDAANNQAGDSQQAHSKRQRVAPGYHAAAAMAAGAAAMAYAPYPSFTAYASAANPYIMYAHAMQPVVGMQPLPAPPPPIAPNAPNAQAANAGSNAGANAGVNADPSLPETNQFIVMFNRREGFKSRSTTHIAIARGIMQHRAFMESQGHMMHRPAAPAAARPAVAPVSQQQMAMQVAQQQAQYQQRLVQQASNQQAHALAHAMVHGQPRHFQRQGPAHASLSRPVRAQRAESNNGHAKVYMAQSVEADHVPLSQRQKRG